MRPQGVSSEYIHHRKHDIVLRLVSFSLPKGSVTAILGPSGSGKTTLLRVIAGFQDYGGGLFLDGRDIEDIPIPERHLAFVSQQRALYPRFTVFDNIAFPLRMAHMPAEEIRARVKEIAKDFGIELLLTRKPRQLSGGQQQLVALARGVANYADLFLLDEPFSEVDPPMRKKIYERISFLKEKYGMTFLLVTHDPREATAISDQLLIMDKGEILQAGTPQEIALHPLNANVVAILGGAS